MSNNCFTIDEANDNFTAVTKAVDQTGKTFILDDKKPRYLVVEVENDLLLDLTDDEKIDIVAKRVLKKYLPAFKALAE